MEKYVENGQRKILVSAHASLKMFVFFFQFPSICQYSFFTLPNECYDAKCPRGRMTFACNFTFSPTFSVSFNH